MFHMHDLPNASEICYFFVPVEVEGRYGDRVFDKRELRYEVGEGENYDFPPGLDKALQKMEKLEESVIYLKSRYVPCLKMILPELMSLCGTVYIIIAICP